MGIGAAALKQFATAIAMTVVKQLRRWPNLCLLLRVFVAFIFPKNCFKGRVD